MKQQEFGWEQYKSQYDWQFQQTQEQFKQYVEQAKLQQESMKTEGDLAVRHEANQIDAQEQLTRGQIDKIIADMDIFQAELKNKIEAEKVRLSTLLESDRLEWEKKAKMIEVQEKIMEEKRMAGDQALEVKRMMLEHERAMKETVAEKKGKSESSAPVINLHSELPINLKEARPTRKRKYKAKRSKDGTYEIETEDIEDSEDSK